MNAARAPGASTELRFAAAVTLAYAVLVGAGLARHEMWRDELQAWLIARDSASIAELFANTRYEGHAPLWFLVLFALTRLTRAPEAMQLLTGVIATGTTFLLAWRAPLPRLWRALLPFGFFLAYDYAVVSRPYALSALLLVAWCAAWTARRERWLLPAVLLALLANTSVYGALLAAAALAAMLVALRRDHRWRDPRERRAAAGAALLVAVAAVGSAIWILPPPDHAADVITSSHRTAEEAGRLRLTTLAPFKALVPIPAMQAYPQVWGGKANGLLHGGGPRRLALAGIVGMVVLLATIAAFARQPEALAMVGVFDLLYLSFDLFVRTGATYHHGHIVLALVAGLWLAGPAIRAPRALVTAALAVQVVAALLMIAVDLQRPFSGGRAMARRIEREAGRGQPVVAVPAFTGAAVAGHLDRALHYPTRGTRGTFMRWNLAHRFPGCDPTTAALASVRELADGPGGAFFLAVRPVRDVPAGLDLTLIDSVTGTITGENFFLYRMRRVGRSGTPGGAGAAALPSAGCA